MDLLVTNIGQLVTNDERNGGLLGVIEGAAVAIEGGDVVWVGLDERIPERYTSH